ncbi:MAG TPA: serine/threonine-protein kinase, partial [Polyangiaceae bacterium]
PQIARDEHLRARFDQEAHAANRFVHPGAVEVRDVNVTDDGCPFLVMELLEGESLRARFDRLGPPDTAEILRIADSVLDVLAAAHAQGIIHRDIKPDNLFCLPDGRIKVLDFGVARVREATNELHTRTGTALGTLPYMAPEQVKGMDIDGRVDVFALGATMFRLIAKRHIHEGRSDAELLVKMATLPAPPLASVAPAAPADVCAIVDRALAFDREARYPSVEAMQKDVRVAQKGRSATVALAGTHSEQDAATNVMARRTPSAAASPPATPTVRERRFRSTGLVLPVVGAALLAVVGYGIMRVERDEGPRDPALDSPAPVPDPTSSMNPIAPAVAPGPAEPAPPSSADPRDCLVTRTCEQMCDRECTIACGNPAGCTVGTVHDSSVLCIGPGRCEISCAANCRLKSERGTPLLVHCTPGFECVLENCPGDVERCSPTFRACGTPCPD